MTPTIVDANLPKHDTDILYSKTKVFEDSRGKITVRLDWLRRPGEMAITIDYFGYLIQEGMANFYLSVNGIQREFLTLKQELPNRTQRIKIISFHPTEKVDGVNRLQTLSDELMLDSLLFRNAPYYKQFGDVQIEIKFFCHSRWHGDANNNDANFNISFSSPIDGYKLDHF